ncbi:hypothetical protein [Nonomuraea ceibae]|uniref:hypothetical protein n=1 Tax=Nonomuraea ceibae TaxID=1935170 RepID=UPI001C60080B|nr:hypothetical protein [Nonomuraea ceibae]
MTLTGTFVLAYMHATDLVDAIRAAVGLPPATLGLLMRYLTAPPEPGTDRAEIAAAYGLSVGQLRAGNNALAEHGHVLQVRRCLGRGQWQHLIVVVDTPGTLPRPHEAWVLLDAALAAEQAGQLDVTGEHTSRESAHVPTCDDSDQPQVGTCVREPHIEPVNPFSSSAPSQTTLVATVADLERLAALPPLPAPKDQGHLWLTPGQVLTLIGRYPRRYGELALRTLARLDLPWYLAPSVVALLIAGYDTGQLARALAGVELADHPAAAARWRLDRMLLEDDQPQHTAWRPPSTYVPQQAPPSQEEAVDGDAAAARAQARAELQAIRARWHARGAAA